MMNGAELAGALNRAVHLSVNETARMKDALLDLTIREMLIRLMQTQARNLMIQRSGKFSTANPMAATIEFMVQNLDQNLNMETLARTACMSRAKFFIQFKRIFGQTPAKMLMELRLRKASELIRNAPLSICEVACRCGFENYSHFTTAFKRRFGQSPSLYRKAKRA